MLIRGRWGLSWCARAWETQSEFAEGLLSLLEIEPNLDVATILLSALIFFYFNFYDFIKQAL